MALKYAVQQGKIICHYYTLFYNSTMQVYKIIFVMVLKYAVQQGKIIRRQVSCNSQVLILEKQFFKFFCYLYLRIFI